MSLRALIKFVEEKGYSFIRQKGTHRTYKNEAGLVVIIPMKDGDHINKMLEKKIRKQTERKASDSSNRW